MKKIAIWVIGFVGFAGVVTVWDVATKPWINFSIDSVRFGGNEYQKISFHNTSGDIDLQGKIKVLIKEKGQIDPDLFSERYYSINDSSILFSLGRKVGTSLVCMNCGIRESSIENLSPENFSLNQCESNSDYLLDTNGRDCISSGKFDSYFDSFMKHYYVPTVLIFVTLLVINFLYSVRSKKDKPQ